VISFVVSWIFKLKLNLLLHEIVLSKTLFNLKILDRLGLCTSSLGRSWVGHPHSIEIGGKVGSRDNLN
jgi:hypothetical protein